MRTTLLATALFIGAAATAQELDSLRAVFRDESRSDTVRFEAFRNLIWSGYLFNDPDSARLLADSLDRMAGRKGMAAEQGDAFSIRGITFMIASDFKAAVVELRKAEERFNAAGSAEGVAVVQNNLGNAYWKMGDLSRAIELYTQSLQYSEKVGKKSGIAAAELNIGLIHSDLGDKVRSNEHWQRSLAVAEEIKDLNSIANASYNLSNSARDLGDTAASRAHLQRAIGAYRDVGNTVYYGTALGNLAQQEAKDGHYVLAHRLVDSSMAVLGPLGDEYMIRAQVVRAQIHLDEGLPREAIRAGEALRGQADSIATLIDAKDLYSILATAYHAIGDHRLAYDRLERFYALQDSLVNDENKTGLLRQEFRYLGEKRALADSLTYASDKAVQLKEIQKQKVIRNGFVGGFALVALFAGVFLVQRNRISKARKRSDELLLNILPSEVADELKADGTSAARQFDQATIFFSDFKGFTSISERLSAAQLVEELNVCFKAFDHIVTAHGIEKIKTIGDAYMCAGGLPVPGSSSPAAVVRAALDMQDFMQRRKVEREAAGLPAFEMRVGIHTGPVVAGIVGVKKFAYDIWGDTVNIASRMESSGAVGQVNISAATHELVKGTEGLSFTPRGRVEAKGKGELEMFFVRRSSEGT